MLYVDGNNEHWLVLRVVEGDVAVVIAADSNGNPLGNATFRKKLSLLHKVA